MQLGKYSTDRDNILHLLCTSEWSNDSFGDVEAPTGYVWRISNTFEDVQIANTEVTSMIEDQLKSYDIEDTDEFRQTLVGHFLIWEDSNGFVSVNEYPTEDLLIQAYESLEAIYSEWDEQEDIEQENYDAWHSKHVCVNCGGTFDSLTVEHMCTECHAGNFGQGEK